MRRTPTHARRTWAAFGAVALATGALAPAASAADADAPTGAPGTWKIDHIGVGSGGSAVLGTDGTLVVDATSASDKIADSEDGFWYYYTPVDAATENFTLTATFTIDDAAKKDGQSGFGLLAVDDLVPGSTSARYMNSVGTMAARYRVDGATVNGMPGARIVTGYTDAPTVSSAARDMTQSRPFDLAWRDDRVPTASSPRFETGDTFTYTLRRSNTGYHLSTVLDGTPHEQILYDRDVLDVQSAGTLYVGIAVARKIKVSVSDIRYTVVAPAADDPAQPRPTEHVTPRLVADVPSTTSGTSLTVPVTANVHGTAVVVDAAGTPVSDVVTLVPDAEQTLTMPLVAGRNTRSVRLTPAPRATQTQLKDWEELTSYDPVLVDVSVTVDRLGIPGEAIFVAPDGTPEGAGTPASPVDARTAVAYVQPGQQIVLAGGTYALTDALTIARGNDGTADAPITLMSAPGQRAVLDLAGSARGGILLRGNHWHLYDLELKNAPSTGKALLVSGSHNVVERIESHHNEGTGIQVSAVSDSTPRAQRPAHNLVVSSVSHNNADPSANDADGFAAKLTVGDGNVFRWNIAHHNIDDGWDLYAKSTTGTIGNVVVEQSVAYANGRLADPADTRVGEGNGFKLGGESMPGQHVLRDSVAFDNLASGVTSNSGPDVRVERVTSVGSASRNLSLYTSAATTDYRVSGFLSWLGTVADQVALKNQVDTITTDPSNVLDLRTGGGALARAASATSADVDATWFESVDTSTVPTIAADGSVDMHGLLVPTAVAPAGTGAVLGTNPSPTRLVVMPAVGSSVEPTVPPTTPLPTNPPTTPPTTAEPTDEPDPTQEPTQGPTTTAPPTDGPSTGTPTDDGLDDTEGDDDATDGPTDDAAGSPDDELPVTGVAGGTVAAVLAAILLTAGAVLRSRREQEV
ncbi:right-handed parallel beta-helix repeat-containing protein [Sanguibacter sp. HDW7]|uniref:right-handed parallel beta-helix repeat-containing protein n=1 Tax=Sanguibacter sp. HDW7 TaxID=2714931 RepID=UPI0014089C0C|nr:right-handed parallel beta-helix repeat-containing protein [Sanguibacter sp. HDW7]QIK84050.1 hypothetical protein G7063_10785 [Sanguibacter sp. HDW7]